MLTFKKDLSQPDPIPVAAQNAVADILKSGTLFRYGNIGTAGAGTGVSWVSRMEVKFARFASLKYAVAMNSGGCAIFVALKALGAKHGDLVLTNAYTLAPVPGSIAHAGCIPVLVECTPSSHSMSLDDLKAKYKKSRDHSPGRSIFCVLSYMRGRLPEQLSSIIRFCKQKNIKMVEDCAHTLGGSINGKKVGSFGDVACFSLQTNKLLNCGEGGILCTDDESLLHRAIIMSGSYGHYGKHVSRGNTVGEAGYDNSRSDTLENLYLQLPNFSMRMNEVTGCIAYYHLDASLISEKIDSFNRHWAQLKNALDGHRTDAGCTISIPARLPGEYFVGSSFQFNVGFSEPDIQSFTSRRSETVYEFCEALSRNLLKRNVTNAWFGRRSVDGFTSIYRHWQYTSPDKITLASTDSLLETLFDMPLYHTSSYTAHDIDELIVCIKEAIQASIDEIK